MRVKKQKGRFVRFIGISLPNILLFLKARLLFFPLLSQLLGSTLLVFPLPVPICIFLDFEQDYFLLLLPAILLATIPFSMVSPQSTSNSRKSLEDIRGIHVIPHSPFSLEEFTQQGDYCRTTCKSSTDKANQWVLVQRVWQQRPGCLRPIKTCMHGDQTITESIANVLTSLPFIALGLQAPRKNLNTKLYANSLIGVGVASSLYHASRGKLRKYLRWFDYTMIATATMCLSGALRNENPKFLMAASAALLPIQPLMVSAVHTGMMEVAFAKRALEEPELRVAHQVHKMSSMLGGVLFVADDMFPTTPFLHAGWHLAAAIGVGTCNKLLE